MKELIIAFLMPPGLAVILAMLAFYFLIVRHKKKLGITFLVLSIVLGWVFSTEAMGRLLTTGLIAQVDHRKDFGLKDVDMVVVLTGGMRYAGQEAGWLPKMDSFERMSAGLQVHQGLKNSRTPILLSGGKTHGPHYPSEASVLKKSFDRDNARILTILKEEVSTNTYENALQSAMIIHHYQAERVLLVTSEEHMLRALAAFRGRGIDPLPLRVYTMDRGPLAWYDFLPSYKGVRITAKALYEMYAIVEYLMAERVRMDDVFYVQKQANVNK